MLTHSTNANMQDPSPFPTRQTRILASQFNYSQLADIYNQTRVDYIVPMPMNAHYMEQYIAHYDVNLDTSIISYYDKDVSGIAMMGLRDERAWITRLGVVPEMRGKKVASFLLECLVRKARARGIHRIQLEIIKGNDPAFYLFSKFGFKVTRELAIIRRPPAPVASQSPLPDSKITLMTPADIADCLNKRPDGISWIEETKSLMQMGNLQGYKLEALSGEWGWVVFHQSKFQLGHFVLDASGGDYDRIVVALLNHIHQTDPLKDTKIENIPVDHPALPLFRDSGYLESFRRFEMSFTL